MVVRLVVVIVIVVVLVVVAVVVVAVGHSSGPEVRGPNLGNFQSPSTSNCSSSSSSRSIVL